MARRPLAARFVYLSCLAAGIVVHTSATRFASTAAPHHHQEERHSFQPHEVGERCRAAKAFPLVKDVSRGAEGGLLKNAVLHFASELPEGEQLTAERAPKLVDREYRREYSLDEFEIIVPPEEQDGGEKEPQPHEEALAEMAGKTLREELWVLLGALDRRLHLLEGRKWFDFRNVLWTHRHHWLGGSDSIGREMTGEEIDAGHMFPAQFAALRALLGEQIAVGYEDTAAARLRQLRGLAVGVEALSKRIDLQEQLQALEALPRVNVGSTTRTGASAIMMATLQLLTHKVGISRENVSEFIQPVPLPEWELEGSSSTPSTPIAMPSLLDPDSGEPLSALYGDFLYSFQKKHIPSGDLSPRSYLLRTRLQGGWSSADHHHVVAGLLLDVEQAEARVADEAVQLPVLVAALCQTWRNLSSSMRLRRRAGAELKAILTELTEHIPIAIASTSAPPVLTSQRLLSLAALVSQLLKLESLEQRLDDLRL